MIRYLISRFETAPHAQDPLKPAQSVCGKPLVGSVEVTENQLITYFGGRRCPDCARREHGGPR